MSGSISRFITRKISYQSFENEYIVTGYSIQPGGIMKNFICFLIAVSLIIAAPISVMGDQLVNKTKPLTTNPQIDSRGNVRN